MIFPPLPTLCVKWNSLIFLNIKTVHKYIPSRLFAEHTILSVLNLRWESKYCLCSSLNHHLTVCSSTCDPTWASFITIFLHSNLVTAHFSQQFPPITCHHASLFPWACNICKNAMIMSRLTKRMTNSPHPLPWGVFLVNIYKINRNNLSITRGGSKIREAVLFLKKCVFLSSCITMALVKLLKCLAACRTRPCLKKSKWEYLCHKINKTLTFTAIAAETST